LATSTQLPFCCHSIIFICCCRLAIKVKSCSSQDSRDEVGAYDSSGCYWWDMNGSSDGDNDDSSPSEDI